MNYKTDYFFSDTRMKNNFYRIPKQLFIHPTLRKLSDGAKLLYALMLGRMELSCQNNWRDTAGRIYIYYTITDITLVLGCATQKAQKMIDELEKADLLERKRLGLGKPSMIYLKRILVSAQVRECDE